MVKSAAAPWILFPFLATVILLVAALPVASNTLTKSPRLGGPELMGKVIVIAELDVSTITPSPATAVYAPVLSAHAAPPTASAYSKSVPAVFTRSTCSDVPFTNAEGSPDASPTIILYLQLPYQMEHQYYLHL